MMSLNFQKKSKCYGNQTQCLRFAGQSIYDHKVQRHISYSFKWINKQNNNWLASKNTIVLWSNLSCIRPEG